MPKYNLDALGHEEFERLSQSLVQQIIGPGVKVYGMGSDGAREATFRGKAPYPSKEEQWDGSWIFQSKFHDVQQIGPREARRRLLAELDDELSKIIEKHKYPCDNYILITNVSLTPAFQKGIKDKIDGEIIPKYRHVIRHIHVWGAEEICRFLDAYPNIRQTYTHFLVSGDVIARLTGLIEREETDLDELVKLYCYGCYTHERSAALDDAGDVEDKPVALQNVFVDLDVKPSMRPSDVQLLERLPEWLRQACEDEERVSALSYILDDSVLGLVLVGGPGGGKSTLGQYIAQIHRARLIGKFRELGKNMEEFQNCIPRVPFRILLREYVQWIASRNNSDSLFHYLAVQVSRESGKNVRPEDIHKVIKANSVLLILDGLDEVSEKRLRTRVLDNISSFVNQVRDVLKGDLRVIATTRPYGYSEEFDPRHYLHLTLQKLSSQKTVLYAKLWTGAREPNPREAERILDTLSMCLQDKVVSVLTQTPLQVTILLVIIRARGTPPKQREELFERYMDIIYQREVKRRPELLRTERDTIYGLHKYLAYILHKRAEKGETVALMDITEFRKRVEEYLIYTNPLLDRKELEDKVNQIITEASQRLVLIESPQEGKIGFGLTTIREFFAAAHLVDTAKDTQERDSRFKAIARSPHWRNVALFFSGRVGRTRPGEAPSMIDVCREIDTERADRFLNRGAELVTDIIDDHDLREPHNEIGAIQYGLTLLDSGFIKEPEDFINRLNSLPEHYKERVIRPWIEERLKNVVPENLEIYADIYQKLFGVREPLRTTIKQASECDLEKVRLWALSQAFKNKIVESWVIKLFEELVDVVPSEELAWTLGTYWPNFRYYLNFPLSLKGRVSIASALLAGIEMRSPFFEPLDLNIIDELSKIKPRGKHKENFLYIWAIHQILMILNRSRVVERYHRRMDWTVKFHVPTILSPYVKEMINTNAIHIKDFCETFCKEDEPLTHFLVALFSFLLEPHNPHKYITISKELRQKGIPLQFATIVPSIFGKMPEDEGKLCEYHKNLYTLYQFYKSERRYRNDIQELHELINKKSKNVRNHPYKFLVWVDEYCDPTIEKFLDSEILNELKNFAQRRNVSENVLSFFRQSISLRDPVDPLDFSEFLLEVIEKRLRDKREFKIWPFFFISSFRWDVSLEKQKSTIMNRLKLIFEEVLVNYSSIRDPEHRQLDTLYWSSLNAGVVKERHMIGLYRIIHGDPKLPYSYWYANAEAILPSLTHMFQSGNLETTRLAAASLSTVLRSAFDPHERKRIEAPWVGDKFWELAKCKEDIWHLRYIEGMACCRLKWAEKSEEFFEAIKEANKKKLQDAWRQVIEGAGYCEDKDRVALFNLLLRILESGNAFAKPIRLAALKRLYEMVSEIEPVGFDEEPLNLPLSRRARTNLS